MRAGWDRHTTSALERPHAAKLTFLALVGFALACALAPRATKATLGAASLFFASVVLAEAVVIARLRATVASARRQAEQCARSAAEAQLATARSVDARQRSEDLTRFLNDASEVLASSLDCDATLCAVARLAVPHVADWVAVELETQAGALRLVALAHADAEKVAHASAADRQRPRAAHEAAGALAVCFGSLGLVSSTSVPLRVQGRPVGAISLGSAESGRRFGPDDVSFAYALAHRASVALENARTFRESEEANRVKDEFLATISHELRTPLNAILGWTTMLRRKPDVDAKKALDTIERNARAQMRLIEDVLDVSRAVTGKLTIEPAEIDLVDVVRAALSVVTPMAEARAIAIETALEALPCPFFGDANRLQQALWNVLSNAIKFSGKGGHVRVSLVRSASHVELVVADTGRGIQPDFLPFVFDRFRQADSSTTRAEGGLGLGLAIVRHIVDLHGGTAKAESPGEGQGTTFTISLPLRAVQGTTTSFALSAAKASSGVYFSRARSDPDRALSSIRVLVCDDDEDARELLGAVLSAEGASVLMAASGSRALESLREFAPHVLISDVGMPQVDGYELIRRVRSLPEPHGGHTPAIALTAYSRREDELKALLAGYHVHVTKPVDPARLVQVVANLVGRPMQRDKERPGN
jgi:signal transduction histidine kinase/CheY-like chemotaxis protein